MTDTLPERAFVWLGGILFVLSLACCAYSYLVLWSTLRGPFAYSASVFDTVLVSVFATHHSVFARERVKRWLADTIPERLLRSVYVWTASVLLILVCVLWQPIGGSLYRVTGWHAIVFATIQLVGMWFIARSVSVINALDLAGIRRTRLTPEAQGLSRAIALRRFDVLRVVPSQVEGRQAQGVLSLSNHAGLKACATTIGTAGSRQVGATGLQVTGPYRLVRHPVYLGWILAVFGPAHMTGDRLAFAAITTIYLMIAIPLEERSLVGAFGDQYELYKRRVKWRVVPYIY